MMSWSYQSTNPCTVLVKEKQDRDSNNVDCSPSIQQSSTNRPIEQSSPSTQHDHQQDSSLLGNNIGGKRKKRQVLDVVVDDDGHEHVVSNVEKRILVNITIGMDKGLGTEQQEVYQLQVAVPLKSPNMTEHNADEFYAYDVHEHRHDEKAANLEEIITTEDTEQDEQSTETTSIDENPSTFYPCDCGGLRTNLVN